jgi:uncharacterized phage protein (TIGR01671 family)
MNRELKFRAWDKTNKVMLYEFLIGSSGNTFIIKNIQQYEPNVFTSVIPEMKDVIIMQFTGFKDYHGKEIFEGDIIKRNGKIYLISWVMSTLGFVAASLEFSELHWTVWKESEIVGNIFQNPEFRDFMVNI